MASSSENVPSLLMRSITEASARDIGPVSEFGKFREGAQENIPRVGAVADLSLTSGVVVTWSRVAGGITAPTGYTLAAARSGAGARTGVASAGATGSTARTGAGIS